jgi:hypothetical protein
MESTGVYVIEGNNLIKIGVASNLIYRLKDIQCQCPVKIKLVNFISCPDKKTAHHIEKCMHIKANTWRMHGEWFDISDYINDIFPFIPDDILITQVNKVLDDLYSCTEVRHYIPSSPISSTKLKYQPQDYLIRTNNGLVDINTMSKDVAIFLSEHSSRTAKELKYMFGVISTGDMKRCLNYMIDNGIIDYHKSKSGPMLYFII